MHILAAIAGILIILVILWDGFETIILPRRVTRNFRLARLFYKVTWKPVAGLARRISNERQRQALLSYYGPASLILLIIFWAANLILGFALLQWANGSQLSTSSNFVAGTPLANGKNLANFFNDLYLSASAFFTITFGDILPTTGVSRFLAAAEGGLGFGFLALIIGYLPALNNAFSRREVSVTMLDERAGTPPTAYRFIERSRAWGGPEPVNKFLLEWERWCAELMESHLSYPVLAYFRSQHENQSWVAALTMVLDLAALSITGLDGVSQESAQLAFAMARHAAVDLTQIFNTPPRSPSLQRMTVDDLFHLREALKKAGVTLREGPEADQKLVQLRLLYEPYMNALAGYLEMDLPPWLPVQTAYDNWETSAWER